MYELRNELINRKNVVTCICSALLQKTEYTSFKLFSKICKTFYDVVLQDRLILKKLSRY